MGGLVLHAKSSCLLLVLCLHQIVINKKKERTDAEFEFYQWNWKHPNEGGARVALTYITGWTLQDRSRSAMRRCRTVGGDYPRSRCLCA